MNAGYGPLNQAPRGLRPPYTVRDPRQVRWEGEPAEQWRTRMHADRLATLLDPLDGIELGTYDQAIVNWLAGWDIPTVATIASLLHRTRRATPPGGAR